jgi:hypothetical protein
MPDHIGDNLNVDVELVWETAAQHCPAMVGAYHAVDHTGEVIWRHPRRVISIRSVSSTGKEDTAAVLRDALTAHAHQHGTAGWR